MRYNDPVVNWQRSRLRQHLGIKQGDGKHLSYEGLLAVDSEALYDVFGYFEDKWKDADIGLPVYYLIDISGTSIRNASPEETRFIMSHKLEKRHSDHNAKL